VRAAESIPRWPLQHAVFDNNDQLLVIPQGEPLSLFARRKLCTLLRTLQLWINEDSFC